MYDEYYQTGTQRSYVCAAGRVMEHVHCGILNFPITDVVLVRSSAQALLPETRQTEAVCLLRL